MNETPSKKHSVYDAQQAILAIMAMEAVLPCICVFTVSQHIEMIDTKIDKGTSRKTPHMHVLYARA